MEGSERILKNLKVDVIKTNERTMMFKKFQGHTKTKAK